MSHQHNAMCTSIMIPRKWHIYNRFELITFITYIHSIGFSLLNTIKLHTQFAISNMILPTRQESAIVYQNITNPNAHGNPMESITQETQDILQENLKPY
jgi:hypothetical protein